MKVVLSALLFISSVIYGSTEIESIGGKIGLVQQVRKLLYDDENYRPFLDEYGHILYEEPVYSYIFTESETYSFTDTNITLEPIPNEGYLFTYWVIDGTPMTGEIGTGTSLIDGFVYGGFNSITFDASITPINSIKAIFSPQYNGSQNQDLSPIGNLDINLSENPSLKATTVKCEGGTIGWVQEGRKTIIDPNGMPLRNETGDYLTNPSSYAKQFRNDENFIFPNSDIILEPVPDDGNTFTYWLIDGKPLIGDRSLYHAIAEEGWLEGGLNSISFDANSSLPNTIQAVFSPSIDGTDNQDLSPIGNPVIDLSLNPSLNKTLLISEHGSIGWVQKGRQPLLDNIGLPRFDENGDYLTSPPSYAKEFIGSEEFVFSKVEYSKNPLGNIILEPSPNDGFRFSHWEVDLKPVTGYYGHIMYYTSLSAFVVKDSIVFDENASIPTVIEAVFVENPDHTWTDNNGANIVGTLASFSGETLKVSENGIHREYNLADFDVASQSAIIKQGLELIQEWVDENGTKIWAYYDDLNGTTLSLRFFDERYTFDICDLSKETSALAINLKTAASIRKGIDLGQSQLTPYTNSWFYIPSRGWMWSSNSVFPWFYESNSRQWYYFRAGSNKPLFYDNSNKRWLNLE